MNQRVTSDRFAIDHPTGHVGRLPLLRHPLGRPTIEQTDTYNAFGLYRPDTKTAWLAVWRLDTVEKRVRLRLPTEIKDITTLQQAYPAEPQTQIGYENGFLTVELPQPYSARLLALQCG